MYVIFLYTNLVCVVNLHFKGLMPDRDNNCVCMFVLQPLMRRFQKTLKEHLVKQQNKFLLQLRELVGSGFIIFFFHYDSVRFVSL